jgi:hypothetical protein
MRTQPDKRPSVLQIIVPTKTLIRPTTYYRIVERYSKGVRTLFHGTNHSRHLEPGVWLKSKEQFVQDGTGGRIYTSGWHILKTKEEAQAFKDKQFRTRLDKLEIIPVLIKGKIWKKSHSRSEVWLAEWMKI